MDTRNKIAGGEQCRERLSALRHAQPGMRVVSGFFDPVLPDHCARLEAASDGAPALAVVLLDPPDPILPSQARAELVASLACVSLVLVPSAADIPQADLRLEQEDLAVRARFEAHVRERQS